MRRIFLVLAALFLLAAGYLVKLNLSDRAAVTANAYNPRLNRSDPLLVRGSLLDSEGRPLPFYGRNVHENCPYLGKYDEGKFSATFTEKDGCRYDLGCKGPGAYCDSFERKWNGVNWCVANAICIGCTEPSFPDGQSPFYSN